MVHDNRAFHRSIEARFKFVELIRKFNLALQDALNLVQNPNQLQITLKAPFQDRIIFLGSYQMVHHNRAFHRSIEARFKFVELIRKFNLAFQDAPNLARNRNQLQNRIRPPFQGSCNVIFPVLTQMVHHERTFLISFETNLRRSYSESSIYLPRAT